MSVESVCVSNLGLRYFRSTTKVVETTFRKLHKHTHTHTMKKGKEDDLVQLQPLRVRTALQRAPGASRADVMGTTEVKCCAIGSNCLVIVTSSGRLIRWTVPGPPPTMESQCVNLLPRLLSRSPRGTEFTDVVRDIHLDFSGWHAIVTVSTSKSDRTTQSTWYIHGTATKPRELRKLKHHVVRTVAWNRANGDSENTSQILMGTSAGCILGMQLDRVSGSKSSTARLIDVHVLYQMKKPAPICGLYQTEFPHQSDKSYVILMTSPPPSSSKGNKRSSFSEISMAQFHEFVGGPTPFEMFKPYSSSSSCRPKTRGLHIVTSSDDTKCQLEVYEDNFTILSERLICYGKLVFGSQNAGESLIRDAKMLRLTSDKDPVLPISIAATKYHFLVLFPKRLVAIRKIDEARVMSMDLNTVSRRFLRDAETSTLWIWSSREVFSLSLGDENRDMWKVHLRRASFEAALSDCRDRNQKMIVRRAQAMHLFEKKQFTLAAKCFMRTDIPFESVVDMFLRAHEEKGLNVYVELMLKSMAAPKPCAQQRTTLATWLLQRYLMSTTSKDITRKFLSKHVDILDLSTTMSMLASSGEMDLFLGYAESVEAWDRVCEFLHRIGDFKRLLRTLESLPMNVSEKLLYEYSNVLIENETEATIRFWMTKGSWLNPERLLSSALRVCHKRFQDVSSLVLRWMESTIEKQGVSEMFHDAHLTILVRNTKKDSDAKLLNILKRRFERSNENVTRALRICLKLGKQHQHAISWLFCRLSMYERALEEILRDRVVIVDHDDEDDDDNENTVSIQTVREIINRAGGSERKRTLWKQVAEHMLRDLKDVEKVMGVLRMLPCSASLKEETASDDDNNMLDIHDLLQYLPDNMELSSVSGLVKSMMSREQNQIQELQTESKRHDKTSNALSNEMKSTSSRVGCRTLLNVNRRFDRNRTTSHEPARCDLSGAVLAKHVRNEGLFVFPCGHMVLPRPLMHFLRARGGGEAAKSCPICGISSCENVGVKLGDGGSAWDLTG